MNVFHETANNTNGFLPEKLYYSDMKFTFFCHRSIIILKSLHLQFTIRRQILSRSKGEGITFRMPMMEISIPTPHKLSSIPLMEIKPKVISVYSHIF